MDITGQISEALQQYNIGQVKELVTQGMANGINAIELLEKGLMDGMNKVGEKFKNNEVYVPEVLVAARAMNKGLEILAPQLLQSGLKSKGKAVLGTVKGDLHDIGKNLVKIMFQGKGIEVIDLGTDVTPQKLVDTAEKEGATIIACSALLTTTMIVMKDVVELVKARGLAGKVKVMIGGAPVTESFRKSIGADCYTADAASAADKAVELLS
jgi:corrinoid protein of di/trimethylamine methyltransferase